MQCSIGMCDAKDFLGRRRSNVGLAPATRGSALKGAHMKTDKNKGPGTMEKAYNDFMTFSQDNIDAFVRANAAVTRGFEQLSKTFVSLATKSMEEAVEASKKFAGVKSFSEAIDLQGKLT